jgi:SAM-dependent methyltransferase
LETLVKELSKSIPRRLREPNFLRRYFVGKGVDIGGKPDPLTLYAEFFPLMGEVKVWDLEDGDAQLMAGVADETYDFVHSSHCLEHLHDPAEGLRNWLRILRPGGYIVVTIPDEDIYEQGTFPSTFNRDHKVTFTIHKDRSWSPSSVNVLGLLASLGPTARVEKVELLDASYRYALPRYDQTVTPVGECAIEFVVRKASNPEAEIGARVREASQPDPALRLHYNQYRNDYAAMKSSNNSRPPFTNDDPL